MDFLSFLIFLKVNGTRIASKKKIFSIFYLVLLENGFSNINEKSTSLKAKLTVFKNYLTKIAATNQNENLSLSDNTRVKLELKLG